MYSMKWLKEYESSDVVRWLVIAPPAMLVGLAAITGMIFCL